MGILRRLCDRLNQMKKYFKISKFITKIVSHNLQSSSSNYTYVQFFQQVRDNIQCRHSRARSYWIAVYCTVIYTKIHFGAQCELLFFLGRYIIM